LKSIYELGVDRNTREIAMKEICKYDHKQDSWNWIYAFSEDKQVIGEEENTELLAVFLKELRFLSDPSGRDRDAS
jgi:hypothetical protein